MHSTSSTVPPRDYFATTHWTVVLAAGERRTPQSDRALEELCRTYWFPLYAYVRRRGHSREDAEDLTQAFLALFLQKNYLGAIDREKGKFRAFLLTALKHFLANEWDKLRTQKRGGQLTHLSLDWKTADTQFQIASTNEPAPDKAFDREWAMALLDQVIQRLQDECTAEGRPEQFARLKVFLTAGKGAIAYAEVAKVTGLNEAAIRAAVHRLRKRYRQLLREEIARTLADPTQVEEEMRALFGAFE
jgi:RNA polymerase sigma factor (sigma-70 family)